jgi:hypothetical protein
MRADAAAGEAVVYTPLKVSFRRKGAFIASLFAARTMIGSVGQFCGVYNSSNQLNHT